MADKTGPENRNIAYHVI